MPEDSGAAQPRSVEENSRNDRNSIALLKTETVSKISPRNSTSIVLSYTVAATENKLDESHKLHIATSFEKASAATLDNVRFALQRRIMYLLGFRGSTHKKFSKFVDFIIYDDQ